MRKSSIKKPARAGFFIDAKSNVNDFYSRDPLAQMRFNFTPIHLSWMATTRIAV
jgi:hypothetical protein